MITAVIGDVPTTVLVVAVTVPGKANPVAARSAKVLWTVSNEYVRVRVEAASLRLPPNPTSAGPGRAKPSVVSITQVSDLVAECACQDAIDGKAAMHEIAAGGRNHQRNVPVRVQAAKREQRAGEEDEVARGIGANNEQLGVTGPKESVNTRHASPKQSPGPSSHRGTGAE